MHHENDRDEFIMQLKDLTDEKDKYPSYYLEGDILLYKGRLVISRNSYVIPLLLKEYHDSSIGGHLGETKTYLKVAAECFWAGMKQQIVQYVK